MRSIYAKLPDGTWGAWINLGEGEDKIKTPAPGDMITIHTKAGETQLRTIRRIVKDLACGVVVSLVPNKTSRAATGK